MKHLNLPVSLRRIIGQSTRIYESAITYLFSLPFQLKIILQYVANFLSGTKSAFRFFVAISHDLLDILHYFYNTESFTIEISYRVHYLAVLSCSSGPHSLAGSHRVHPKLTGG